MKTTKLLSLMMFIIAFFSCNNNSDLSDIESLKNTKWKLLKIVNKTTGEQILPPANEEDVKLIFRSNGKINLENLCNFSHAKYQSDNKTIKFSNLGPSTEMYCEPIHNIEIALISALNNANEYSIANNRLILRDSNSELKSSIQYEVVFEYIGTYDNSKGKVVFITNAQILNCIFEIDVFIDAKKIASIKGGSQYNDNDCNCYYKKSSIGIIHSIKEGKYQYSAVNTKCNAVNTTNKWQGEITVIGDSCIAVMLDVNPK